MTELIPRSVLFSNPERAAPALSPDGRRMVFSAPRDGVQNLWVQVDDEEPRPVTADTGQGIWVGRWAFDGRHLLYYQDATGGEDLHLFALDLETATARDLTPFAGVRAELIGLSAERPSEIAVALNDRDPALHDAYRVTLKTGSRELAARNPGGVAAPDPASPGGGWLVDAQLQVRARTRADETGGVVVEVRESEDDVWRELRLWSLDDSRNSTLLGFDAQGGRLRMIDSSRSPAGRLVEIDVQSGEETILLDDAPYDVTRLFTHPVTGAPLVAGVLRERAGVAALDREFEHDVRAMQALGAPTIVGSDADAQSLVLHVNHDDRSPTFVRFHRDRKEAVDLFDLMPALNDYQLAQMDVVSYRSVDGLEIPAFLTRPVGAAGPTPLVVFPHGGPWNRDLWGFAPSVQWLANRGYAVLQPNFRGSTGYGKQFLNAGNREWGKRMLDDVLAGAEWAVDQGVAKRDKLGIYGGSFGGYMVLSAIAFAPDVFACAIDLFGWSDLVQALKSLPAYWGPRREQWFARVGHPELEPDFLWSRSPLSRVDDIRTPLLVAHGANDVRVLKDSSDRIVEALKARGVPCEYIVFDDEGHGFKREANRMAFHAAAERFLADHLGGRCEL